MPLSIEDSKVISKIAGNPWLLMILSFFLFGLSGFSCLRMEMQQQTQQTNVDQIRTCLSVCNQAAAQSPKVCSDACSNPVKDTNGDLFGFAFGLCGFMAALGYIITWVIMRDVALDVFSKFRT